jgi:hypothetical protein
MFPDKLKPVATEPFDVSGDTVLVSKARPKFELWSGPAVADTCGGKVVLNAEGRPAFAELLVLHWLRLDGWAGVWVDTYRRRYVTGYADAMSASKQPPPSAEAVLTAIRENDSTHRAAPWDVLAWRGAEAVFVECKRRHHDAIRPTQRAWFTAAMATRFSSDCFLVVEWTARGKN